MGGRVLKTIKDIKLEGNGILSLDYHKKVTKELDSLISPFDQNTLNAIVLWKTRYAEKESETIILLNKINYYVDKLDEELTVKKSLGKQTEGCSVGLPIASNFLRFRNKNVSQIIDQRSYHFSYGTEFILKSNFEVQIKLYFKMLKTGKGNSV